jgi:lysophospholipase L1-like esterase
MKVKNGQTLLFMGDSITDCGRAHPVGMHSGLGEGYVAFVGSLMAACHPKEQVRVLNMGISGDRVTDLKARWQADVMDLKPNWLSVMIGINDVWRQFDNVLDPDQVAIDRYETVYRELLERTHQKLDGLVLMSPYLLEPDPNDPMRQQMDAYRRRVSDLSAEFGAEFVDVQRAFDAYLSHRPASTLSDDRVHPNKTGHMIIAAAFLRAIGFDWYSINPSAIRASPGAHSRR